ncbi:hypothetical protein BC940DRAFT_293263 [Gongronella butleri]|nr:hypothetical protein BC940DRAFT_293263 [Gongronella butleri]
MIDGLRRSMRFFGNVVKIVKFTHRGWFEGNVKVTLDKAQVKDQVYEEMEDRRLYLEDFQCAVVASWANAPAICFKCQRSNTKKINTKKSVNAQATCGRNALRCRRSHVTTVNKRVTESPLPMHQGKCPMDAQITPQPSKGEPGPPGGPGTSLNISIIII